jgi:hypothetical protein
MGESPCPPSEGGEVRGLETHLDKAGCLSSSGGGYQPPSPAPPTPVLPPPFRAGEELLVGTSPPPRLLRRRYSPHPFGRGKRRKSRYSLRNGETDAPQAVGGI